MAVPAKIRLSVERVVDVTIVRFDDDKILYDELSLADLSRRLTAMIENDGVRVLLLNFEQVQAFCSYLLGILVRLQKRLVQELRGRLILCAIKSHLMEVFEYTTTDRLFDFAPSEQVALQRF